MNIKIGNGIDFHKLEVNKERPFILGGYIIPTDLSLIGHSDADILLHAIADSILGALSLGDIGIYFPDTDPDFKNMNSKTIIEKVLNLMKEKNHEIGNIDSTIICEKPKIAPHREGIQKSLGNILNIEIDKISVKATTSEKMGALGRSEGICVLSNVLLHSVK
ncbi:MAG: 2-C-methyl-D-erythritol 2,4-cyclodiphosphate synthase [Leptospiraceae bacterium]|nr:2-C-methyl-D-erythritol 2,4-cyclodiphosphate synthase [Leptospiraceae bacterium]MCK6379970.1 2-C-methyl-D-erythritol 2,4-cyclodiphosphate synthase [Leptospiraceae bacterium]NUM40069.1 2-C-methyl-D-erythritol 2,4-cyclodiphosphate synthase [Leptospiraceae bacterium]